MQSMIINWPDAIRCGDGTVPGAVFMLHGADTLGAIYVQTYPIEYRYVKFNVDGTYLSRTGYSDSSLGCQSKNIAQLYTEGRAANFVTSKIQDSTGVTNIVANWPDAIRCGDGSAPGAVFMVHGAGTLGAIYAQVYPNEFRYVKFNADGTYLSKTGHSDSSLGCKNKNIALLYAEGRAANFVTSRVQDGVGVTSMMANWPDAIICGDGTAPGAVFMLQSASSTPGAISFYVQIYPIEYRYVNFNSDGTYLSRAGHSDSSIGCKDKSIRQLYDSNRTVNLVSSKLLTSLPTETPTIVPTHSPTLIPSTIPTYSTFVPTILPSATPTNIPTVFQTERPTINPTKSPSNTPTTVPTIVPTFSPTLIPSMTPTAIPTYPTFVPTILPSATPTNIPTVFQTERPTINPTKSPSNTPTTVPTIVPTFSPTLIPSTTPTAIPTSPTAAPSLLPTAIPTLQPTLLPSTSPTTLPTAPTAIPTLIPTNNPSIIPSICPSVAPTASPSIAPTTTPTCQPSAEPSTLPTVKPTTAPTLEYTEFEINGGGTYVGTYQPENFVIYSTKDVTITGGGGKDKFTILPRSDVTITITDFDKDNELIDITAFTNIHSIKDFTITYGSALINLPNNQIVRLLTHSPADITTGNFIFAPSSKADHSSSIDSSTIIKIGLSVGLSISSIVITYILRTTIGFRILDRWGHHFKLIYKETDLSTLKSREIGLFKKEEKLMAFLKGQHNFELLTLDPQDIANIPIALHEKIMSELEKQPHLHTLKLTQSEKNSLTDFLIDHSYLGPKTFCFLSSYTELGYLRGFVYNLCLTNFKEDHRTHSRKRNQLSKSFKAKPEEQSKSDDYSDVEMNSDKTFGNSSPSKLSNKYTAINGDEKDDIPDTQENKLPHHLTTDNSESNLGATDFKYENSLLNHPKIAEISKEAYSLGIFNQLIELSNKDRVLYDEITRNIEAIGVKNALIKFYSKYLIDSQNAVSSENISLENNLGAETNIKIDNISENSHISPCCIDSSIYDPNYEVQFEKFAKNLVLAYNEVSSLLSSKPHNQLKSIEDYSESTNQVPPEQSGYSSSFYKNSQPFLNLHGFIESYPLLKYISNNIVYPLLENYIPESLQNVTLPEISNAMLVTAHMSIGHLYAWQQPQTSIPFYIVESVAKSSSFAARLGVTKFINDYRNELSQNEQTVTTTESLKHCVSTLLTYTVPDLLICAAAKAAMPGYECSDMNLGAKLSFAGSECYTVYKASQEPIEPTTADIVVPYIADIAAGVAAYANGYGLIGVVASVVAADWMSRLVMDAAPNNIKVNIEDTFKFLGEIYEHGSDISY